MQLLMSGARASFKVLAGLFRRWFSISPVSNTEIAVVLMFINTSNLVIILLTQRSSVLQKKYTGKTQDFQGQSRRDLSGKATDEKFLGSVSHLELMADLLSFETTKWLHMLCNSSGLQTSILIAAQNHRGKL